MTIQLGLTLRTARMAVHETTIGTAPLLRLRTGAQPANCAAARTGTIVFSTALPSDWLTAAAAGAISKNGTWSSAAIATGTPGHYEIMDSGGTICHEQGSVTFTGSGGDMTVDVSGNVTSGQVVTVTAYSQTDGNA